jgi:ATP-binding cassette subfamily B protein
MSQSAQASDPVAEGRPGEGATLASSIAEAAARRERSRDLRPLGRLLPYLGQHKADAALAFAFLLMGTISSLGLTFAVRYVVDEGFIAGTAEDLNRTFLIVGLVSVALAIATAFRYFFVTRLGERVVADLREGLYAHVLSLDPAFFMRTRTGEVLSRLTTDITLIEGLLATVASLALRNLLMLVGSLTLLSIFSTRLTLYVLILAPAVILPMFIVGRLVRRRSVAAQDKFAQAVGYAGENLDALDTVQAFGREKSAAARFMIAVESAFAASVQRIQARAVLTALVMSLVFGGVAIVLWLGAHAVKNDVMSVGNLFQFAMLSVLAAGSVAALGDVWGEIQKASGAMARISELMDAKPTISAPENPVPMPVPPHGEIAFESVTFAYPGRDDAPALRGFSLHVRPGETVALVGPSGAGKSTVLRLLLRFYDPQSGAVRIDGVNLKDADPRQVRARCALVAQDAALFSGSASDNIRFGREDATEEDIRAAADAAEAEGFLNALPEGFDTPIGERAKTLSGGQRQRLAIARALVRGAPILLLDEATSALDAENERLVQNALARAMEGRTTVVIAHRLATVLKADRIVVMDEGRVVEAGTHDQLSANGGLYARLAKLQFAGTGGS